jgi:hypothetical protein
MEPHDDKVLPSRRLHNNLTYEEVEMVRSTSLHPDISDGEEMANDQLNNGSQNMETNVFVCVHFTKSRLLNRDVLLRKIIDDLLRIAEDVTLDKSFDNALTAQNICKLDRNVCNADVSSQAFDLLCRLPECAPCIDDNENLRQSTTDSPELRSDHWMVFEEVMANARDIRLRQGQRWEDLSSVARADTTTIRLALAITTDHSPAMSYSVRNWLAMLADILDIICESRAYQRAVSTSTYHRLIAFIWSAWHRSRTLFHYLVLRNQLSGYDKTWNDMLSVRQPSLVHYLQRSRGVGPNSVYQKPEYMCTWALELLRSSQATISLNFEQLYKRFAEAHTGKTARCTEDGHDCQGQSPESCGRFLNKALVAEEQSMHDSTCDGYCSRLIWDKKSYMKIQNGRAVCLDVRGSLVSSLMRGISLVAYRSASERTLAISHVWSRGQGGRPSTGINKCLHERYARLAKSHGCDSYWIDTLCIPEDEDLRNEAISYINQTFSDSKMTIVCDKDLMSLHAPNRLDPSDDVRRMERILATLLVCDWNVRAWTLLEAMRGNHNLHILCADNKLVGVKEALKLVFDKGCLQIAITTLACQHLLASTKDGFSKGATRKPIDEAGRLLGHRYATRSGDSIVIWSLLCCTTSLERGERSNPEKLWQSCIGKFLRTGYLMSSAPRLKTRHFSWAPAICTVQYADQNGSTEALASEGSRAIDQGSSYSYDWSGSREGRLSKKGFSAEWFAYRVTLEDKDRYGACMNNLIKLMEAHRFVFLIVPMHEGEGHHIGSGHQKRMQKTLVAACFTDSHDNMDKPPVCTWSGVFEWDLQVPLPEWQPEEILLV